MYCGNCGKAVCDGARFCPYCGDRMVTAACEAAARQKSGEAAARPGEVAASAVLTFFLTAVGLFMVPALFLRASAQELGALGETFAGRLLGSVFPSIFVGAISLLLMAALFFINRRRVRRAFLSAGIGFAAMGVGSAALAICAKMLIDMLKDPWHGVLSLLQPTFFDVELFLSVCLMVCGMLLLCIYACIGSIREAENSEA